MTVHCRANLGFCRLWRFRKQLSSLDNHSIETVAALESLLIDQGLLDRVQFRSLRKLLLRCVPGRDAFESRDRLSGYHGHRRNAGSRLHAIDQNGARATLSQPAAKSRALKIEVVGEDIKKGRIPRRIYSS